MKKIAYLMHIPYEWAKQRPQFLAENLAPFFAIELFTLESYRRKNLRKEKVPFRHHRIWLLPLEDRFKIVRFLNRWLGRIFLGKDLSGKQIVWITHPRWWPSIKPLLSEKHLVVYDCMDNATEFPKVLKNPSLNREIQTHEKELLNRADLALFSSATLLKTLRERYGLKEGNHHVINNGISETLLQRASEPTIHRDSPSGPDSGLNGNKKLVYVGTISEWFDMNLLTNTLAKYPKLEIHVYGPSEISLPQTDRLVFHGPVPHKEIFAVLSGADGLIMPFRITPLIESVNPVKLYEYISAGKPILAPFYDESAQFEDWVYLYRDPEQWDEMIRLLLVDQLKTKQNLPQALEFCSQNTWKEKALFINELIQEALQRKE